MDQACGILPVCSTILNSVVTAISNLEEEVFRNSLSIPSNPQDLLFLSFLVHFKTSCAEISFSKSSCTAIIVYKYISFVIKCMKFFLGDVAQLLKMLNKKIMANGIYSMLLLTVITIEDSPVCTWMRRTQWSYPFVEDFRVHSAFSV